jgi:hypothetical protein
MYDGASKRIIHGDGYHHTKGNWKVGGKGLNDVGMRIFSLYALSYLAALVEVLGMFSPRRTDSLVLVTDGV